MRQWGGRPCASGAVCARKAVSNTLRVADLNATLRASGRPPRRRSRGRALVSAAAGLLDGVLGVVIDGVLGVVLDGVLRVVLDGVLGVVLDGVLGVVPS